MKRDTKRRLNASVSTARLALEAQHVIGLRLMRIMMGSLSAEKEVSLMVNEKIGAALDAQRLLLQGLIRGQGGLDVNPIIALYRRKVRANHKRLTRTR